MNPFEASILVSVMRCVFRAQTWLIAVMLLLVDFISEGAMAEPFQGTASATLAEGITSASLRQQAIGQARRVALGAALRSIRLPKDPQRYEQVRAQAESWTGSYRVLSSESTDQEINVRVEVDVDLPRLRKWVWKRPESNSMQGFRLGQIQWEESCGTAFSAPDSSKVELPLQAYGILVENSKEVLSLDISCKRLGPVSFSYSQGVQIEVQGETNPGGLSLRAQSFGFANQFEDALTVALSRAFDNFSQQLIGEMGTSIDIRLIAAWPAFRIRRLEQALREKVVGIDRAALAAIRGDGDVIIRVFGSVSSKELAEQIQALQFGEFSVYEVEVESSRRVTISLQSFGSDVQLE